MTTVRINPAGVRQLTTQRNGPVQLHMANIGRQIEGEARRRVGVKSGALKRTIGSRLTPTADGFRVEIFAGSPDVPYADFHHDGTKPHVILPKRGRFLVFEKGGKTIFARKVNHPGTKPNPFLVEAARAVGLTVRRRK